MADIDLVLDRLRNDLAFRLLLETEPGQALAGLSLSPAHLRQLERELHGDDVVGFTSASKADPYFSQPD